MAQFDTSRAGNLTLSVVIKEESAGWMTYVRIEHNGHIEDGRGMSPQTSAREAWLGGLDYFRDMTSSLRRTDELRAQKEKS